MVNKEVMGKIITNLDTHVISVINDVIQTLYLNFKITRANAY